MDSKNLAGRLYEKYCAEVGGKAFNGDPLPSWQEFSSDPSKQKQANAWIASAQEVFGAIEKQALQLCYTIEKIPASPEQTDASIAASSLHMSLLNL